MPRSWPAPEQRHEPPRRCCAAPYGRAPLGSIAPSKGSYGSPACCPIKKCLAIVDQPARRREDLASGAGVHVALFVEPEVVPTEGPILAPRLVDDRDVRSDLLVLNEPVEV